MSEDTKTRGDTAAGTSERSDTRIPTPAATAIDASGSRSSGGTRWLKEKAEKVEMKAEKGVDKVKRFFGRKGEGAGKARSDGEGSGGAPNVGAATSAGRDIGDSQVGTQALGQATGTTLTSAAATAESTNNPLDQDPVLGHSGTLAPPTNNTAGVLAAAEEFIQDDSCTPTSIPVQNETCVPIMTGEAAEALTALAVPPTPEIPSSVAEHDTAEEAGSRTLAIAKGTIMTVLGIAAAAIPEPIKGAFAGLLKVVEVIEKTKSNKKEVKALKTRCILLDETIMNMIKGKELTALSDEAIDSIGRLVSGVHGALRDVVKNQSEGAAAYALAEDDAKALEEANGNLDELLQRFWIENLVAGTLVLSDVRQEIQNQSNAALDKLKHFPGAAYDSQDLAKVNTCLEGTRVKLLTGIGRWISGIAPEGLDAAKPIYVLDGIAGIGKSTVSKTVAQRAAGINSLGASFFFSRDHAEQQHASIFVHTIAYQLACCNPSYGEAIATAIDNHPESLHKVIAQQFSTLVAEPLCSMLKQRATPLVFVFDALDECVEPDASAVLSLIITSISQLPKVKVFLTARPELVLRNEYQNTPLANCFHLQNIEALIVDSDINLYLNHCFSSFNIQKIFMGMKCASWVPTEEEKRKLVLAADRLFIFASTAAKAILDQKHLNPKRQLDAILSIRPTNAITSLYMQVLNGAKPLEDCDSWLDSFKTAIGALVALQYPLPIEALADLLGIESDELNSILANLHAVLAPINDGPNPTYRIHHKSFADFVTNAGQSQEYFVKEQDYHMHLAKCCLQIMKQQLHFNICQISPADQYKELANLPNLNREKLTHDLEYAVCNWAIHLNKGNPKSLDKDGIKQLLQEFASIHLMHWLETLAYLGKLDTAHSSMKTALAVLAGFSI
ncbi:hypothetical protein EST38_g3395 [Candolleomyces aberdarensis]|uniref:Nephrocystin 3-like N-terminal domain-containing protein n=1 Tax=Candolleomyces aberdarensis TaxID=2316362 RepID=A0A4V1Q4L0_9AGAR|nr:hypothetical protein EST38_g3395 [Candolleomyces aberdarensis]